MRLCEFLTNPPTLAKHILQLFGAEMHSVLDQSGQNTGVVHARFWINVNIAVTAARSSSPSFFLTSLSLPPATAPLYKATPNFFFVPLMFCEPSTPCFERFGCCGGLQYHLTGRGASAYDTSSRPPVTLSRVRNKPALKMDGWVGSVSNHMLVEKKNKKKLVTIFDGSCGLTSTGST